MSEPASSSTSPRPPPQCLIDGLPLPKVFVFDLDYTLWPFWVDTHPMPPLKSTGVPNSVRDAAGNTYDFYPEVPVIMTTLRKSGVKVAAASRTHAPELARKMAGLLTFPPEALRSRKNIKDEGQEGSSDEDEEDDDDEDNVLPKRLWDYFDHTEIYPGSKIRHFKRIKNELGIEFEDMVFFDDEHRNIEVERGLGVVTVIVPRGITGEKINEGVRRWRNLKSGKKEKNLGDEGKGKKAKGKR